MPWKKEENILRHYLFGDKNHSKLSQNRCKPINMIMIYYWDKKLKKILHVLEADIMTILKKTLIRMSLAQRMYFLQDVFILSTIALVSVIDNYHINGLHYSKTPCTTCYTGSSSIANQIDTTVSMAKTVLPLLAPSTALATGQCIILSYIKCRASPSIHVALVE